MQITQSHINEWIKDQTQNLIDSNDVVVDRKVVVDLTTFWIECEIAFLDHDKTDDQYLSTRSRIKGEMLEIQKKPDSEIVNEVAQRMLEPFAYEGALEQAREEQDDFDILDYQVRRAEGWR